MTEGREWFPPYFIVFLLLAEANPFQGRTPLGRCVPIMCLFARRLLWRKKCPRIICPELRMKLRPVEVVALQALHP
jgi:hypothetical protein